MIDKVLESGRKLFQSAENLRRSSTDLDALIDSLWEMLSEQEVDIGEVEYANKEDDDDGTDWVSWVYSYNMKIRSRKGGRKDVLLYSEP